MLFTSGWAFVPLSTSCRKRVSKPWNLLSNWRNKSCRSLSRFSNWACSNSSVKYFRMVRMRWSETDETAGEVTAICVLASGFVTESKSLWFCAKGYAVRQMRAWRGRGINVQTKYARYIIPPSTLGIYLICYLQIVCGDFEYSIQVVLGEQWVVRWKGLWNDSRRDNH